MASTFAQLIDEVRTLLRGSVRIQEQSTHLTAAVDDDDLSFTVGDGTRMSLGRAEIGDELVQIDSVSGNTLTIAPYGRGVDGTTAADHAINDQVIYSPLFSRSGVKNAINATLLQLGGQLYGTRVQAVTAAVISDYELPPNCNDVLAVKWEALDRLWYSVNNWRQVRTANTGDFSGGKSVKIYGVPAGRPIEITYSVDPAPLDDDTDVFATATGLPESCRDVVVFGAAWRLLSTVDVGIMDSGALQNGPQQQAGVGTALSQQLFKMFMTRRDEERQKMLVKSDGGIAYV